jgi:hypothetical protein
MDALHEVYLSEVKKPRKYIPPLAKKRPRTTARGRSGKPHVYTEAERLSYMAKTAGLTDRKEV